GLAPRAQWRSPPCRDLLRQRPRAPSDKRVRSGRQALEQGLPPLLGDGHQGLKAKMPYDGAQLVRDVLLVVAAAGGIIKIAEFAVSRRHLAIRAVAGYWDNPDGTSGTLLQIEVHNQGR